MSYIGKSTLSPIQTRQILRFTINVSDGLLTIEPDPRFFWWSHNPSDFVRWSKWLDAEVWLSIGDSRFVLPTTTYRPILVSSSTFEAPTATVDAVLAELLNPRWQFRTPSGIARSIGLDEKAVRNALSALGPRVRRPLAPDLTNRDLYTAAVRKPSWRERYLALKARLGTW